MRSIRLKARQSANEYSQSRWSLQTAESFFVFAFKGMPISVGRLCHGNHTYLDGSGLLRLLPFVGSPFEQRHC
jgi:hypothetical protein